MPIRVTRPSRRAAVTMHLADVDWLIMPSRNPTGLAPDRLDVAALLMPGGSMAVAARARATPVVRLSATR